MTVKSSYIIASPTKLVFPKSASIPATPRPSRVPFVLTTTANNYFPAVRRPDGRYMKRVQIYAKRFGPCWTYVATNDGYFAGCRSCLPGGNATLGSYRLGQEVHYCSDGMRASQVRIGR